MVKIIRDERGNRKPLVAMSLPSGSTDASGADISGVETFVPMLALANTGGPLGPTNPIPVTGMSQSTSSATIASGASLSGAIDLGDRRLVRIATPAAWTTAVLTFQVSYDGATWADLCDEFGTEVSYTLVAGKSMRLPITDWLGVRHLKLRSGTSAVPVNQSAARSFVLVAQ